MSDAGAPDRGRDGGTELVLALLLGAAALLTAISAHLAATQNGAAQDHYTRASGYLVASLTG